jgi:isopenicillin N synthase-like dioxygenase
LPQLKPVLLDWQQETTRLSIRLLRAFAEALQQPVDIFDDAFVEAPVEHLKIIRYPGSQQGAAGQGVGPHKDGGFLTLLLQDDSQDGLQVETEQGWIDAPSCRAASSSISVNRWKWHPMGICGPMCIAC